MKRFWKLWRNTKMINKSESDENCLEYDNPVWHRMCDYCKQPLRNRVSFKNMSVSFIYMEKDQSMHAECYIQLAIDKIIEKRLKNE